MDCYKASQVQSELHLSRENLVGLAVLLGCDYIPKVGHGNQKSNIGTSKNSDWELKYVLIFFHKGIPGVGKEQALKLIHMLKGQTLLQW